MDGLISHLLAITGRGELTMTSDNRVAGLAMNRGSNPDDFGGFVHTDKTTGTWGIISVNIQWDLSRQRVMPQSSGSADHEPG